MPIFLDRKSFDNPPLLFCILKDLVACNIISFDTRYRSTASMATAIYTTTQAIKRQTHITDNAIRQKSRQIEAALTDVIT